MRYFLPEFWTLRHQLYALGGIILLLATSVVAAAFNFDTILNLTPILLAVIAAIMLVIWDAPLKRKLATLGGIIIAGYLVELIGVHTGLLFGDYSYGTIMGFRLWGVPIVIGLTWFIVTLSAWHIARFGKQSQQSSFLLAAGLVLMFDLLLEQFATVYGLWSWQDGSVPLYNYVCWFVLSLVAFWVYHRFTRKAEPSIFIAGQLPVLAVYFWLMILIK